MAMRATSVMDNTQKYATGVFNIETGNVAGHERKGKTHRLQKTEETNKIYPRDIVKSHPFS